MSRARASKAEPQGEAQEVQVVVGESHPEPVRVGPLKREHTHRGIVFPADTHIDEVAPHDAAWLREQGIID